MPLTDKTIRATKPAEKARKLSDEKGLYLLLKPNGARYWRLKYRHGGKERVLALGVYPEISLARAREKRREARQLLDRGIDPMSVRKAEKRAEKSYKRDTFEAVGREWIEKESGTWAPKHADRVRGRLENDVFPFLGSRLAADLDAPEILTVVKRIADRGALDTAHRTLWTIGRVMRFAVATARANHDPTTTLRGALPAARSGHHAAIIDPKRLGEFMLAIDDYSGSQIVRCALRLLPHLFVRPGELRHADWTEFDFEKSRWEISADKMKSKAAHVVPLSKQAIEILREIEPVTGRSQWVFPSGRSYQRPMSENAITAALRRSGYTKSEVTAHGFRATARTLLDEELGMPPHLIEHQLAHAVRDPLGRAYNRTQHLEERRRMMQRWSDYLDRLRDGAE